MRVSFSIKLTAVHSASTPHKGTLTERRASLGFTNNTGWPTDRGTTAIPLPFALTATALISRNPSGSIAEYVLPSLPVTDIWESCTLNTLNGTIDADLGSNLGDKGESLAHNRIVPSKEAEATSPFLGLI